MKKILMKSKKIAAIFVLGVMSLCAVAPVAEAAINRTVIGNRTHNSKGYKSHTRVKAYTEKGYGCNLVVSAKIGSYKTIRYGVGDVKADTDYISSAKDAYHGYGIGSQITYNWQSN